MKPSTFTVPVGVPIYTYAKDAKAFAQKLEVVFDGAVFRYTDASRFLRGNAISPMGCGAYSIDLLPGYDAVAQLKEYNASTRSMFNPKQPVEHVFSPELEAEIDDRIKDAVEEMAGLWWMRDAKPMPSAKKRAMRFILRKKILRNQNTRENPKYELTELDGFQCLRRALDYFYEQKHALNTCEVGQHEALDASIDILSVLLTDVELAALRKGQM